MLRVEALMDVDFTAVESNYLVVSLFHDLV